MNFFSCLVKILLCTPKEGRTKMISSFGDCDGWILRFAFLLVKNIINVVSDNTGRVSILQLQLS